MAARAALARSVRPLLLRRGVATTAPAATAAAVATTGASLRAELEKVQRFSPNLPEETAAVLMTPEVRADVAAISAAEEALMATIDTTDVSVDWVGCPISVLAPFVRPFWETMHERGLFHRVLAALCTAADLALSGAGPSEEWSRAPGDWFSLLRVVVHAHLPLWRGLGDGLGGWTRHRRARRGPFGWLAEAHQRRRLVEGGCTVGCEYRPDYWATVGHLRRFF